MVVDFALYLRDLHWSAVDISLILSAALVLGSALTLIFGPLSDRLGRRHFLIGYEILTALVALVACCTAASWWLAPAAIIGGFGRGGNGAAGPFAPVERAWMGQGVGPEDRGRTYSLNEASGFAGMAAGAAIAALPSLLQGVLPGPLAFRPLFALVALMSVLCVALLALAEDREAPGLLREARAAAEAASDAARSAGEDRTAAAVGEAVIRRRENGLILRLMLANALNGAGIGLTGPLMSYWFAVRFGQGPEAIGPLMAVGFLLASGGSVAAGWLSAWLGVVRSVVVLRLVGLGLFVALPFAPGFGVAAVLFTLRTLCNRSTTGARSALSVTIVRQKRRGLSASLTNVAMQIPRAIGPVFAGALFELGFLGLPFLIGAAFQGAYIYVYQRSFADVA